jgi:hypothetical protein
LCNGPSGGTASATIKLEFKLRLSMFANDVAFLTHQPL